SAETVGSRRVAGMPGAVLEVRLGSSGVSCKSCPDGRGSRAEDLAGVSPVERCRGLVAGLDVGEHLLGEVLGGVEVAVLEQLAAENPEEALDLVEPAGVVGGVHEPPVRMGLQPRFGVFALVRGEVV